MVKENKITLPCEVGDKVYSIIGGENGIVEHTVGEIRIGKDGIHIYTEGSVFLKYNQFGKYYFFDKELAQHEYRRIRDKYERGVRRGSKSNKHF